MRLNSDQAKRHPAGIVALRRPVASIGLGMILRGPTASRTCIYLQTINGAGFAPAIAAANFFAVLSSISGSFSPHKIKVGTLMVDSSSAVEAARALKLTLIRISRWPGAR